MLCFEVWINGKKERVIGFESAEEHSVCLTAYPEHLSDSVSLEMSGFAPSPEVCLDELRWGRSELRLGDEVRIKIVNQEDADTPIRTRYGEGQIGDADKAMICSNCGKPHLEVERMIQAERITLVATALKGLLSSYPMKPNDGLQRTRQYHPFHGYSCDVACVESRRAAEGRR